MVLYREFRIKPKLSRWQKWERGCNVDEFEWLIEVKKSWYSIFNADLSNIYFIRVFKPRHTTEGGLLGWMTDWCMLRLRALEEEVHGRTKDKSISTSKDNEWCGLFHPWQVYAPWLASKTWPSSKKCAGIVVHGAYLFDQHLHLSV